MAKKKSTKDAAEIQQETSEVVEQKDEVVNEVATSSETTDSNEFVEDGSSEENSEASEESSSGEEKEEKKPGREPEVPGSVTKFFKFETSAPRTFNLDSEFVKVTLEKRVRVKAFVNEEATDTFEDILNQIDDRVHRMRNSSIELAPAKAPKGFFVMGRGYPITDIYVPLTKNSSRAIDNIKNFLVNISQNLKGITLRYRIETVAKITVDTSKEHKNVFLKGFLAGATTTSKNKKEDVIELIPEFRGQMFIDKGVGFDIRDVLNMNEVIEMNKVRLYDTKDTEKSVWEYYLPLSKMLAIATYQVIGTTPKGKLKVQRVLSRIRIRNVSVAGIVVPVGVFISMRKDVVSSKKVENFFVDVSAEGKNVSFLETYGELPVTEIPEYASIQQDFEVIDKVIMDSISVVDQTNTEEEHAAETSQPETEVVESEETKTSDEASA